MAHATCFLVILKSAHLVDVQHEEHETFSLHWATAQEIMENWEASNQNHDCDHWIYFFKKTVARAQELGYDTTSGDVETLKAGCVVVNDKHEVLLITDADRKIWTFPKGHMEQNEALEETATRETFEETGYHVQIIKRLGDMTYKHENTGESIRVAMFLARPLGTVETPESQTHSEWFSIEDAHDILYFNLRFLLDECENELNSMVK